MTISTRSVAATLLAPSGDVPLLVTQGSIDMNEAMSPFLGGDITIAHPGLATLALLTPVPGQRPPRIRLDLSKSPGTALSATLNVSARQVNAATGEVGINLVNDEQLLEDWSPTAPINLNSIQSSGVLGIVMSVLTSALGTYGPLNYSPPAAKPFPTFTEVTNLIANSSFETSSGLWTAGRAKLAQATNWALVGTSSLKITPDSTASATPQSFADLTTNLTPGATYTLTGFVRIGPPQTGTLSADARRMLFVASVNGVQSIYARTNAAVNTLNTTTKLSVTFTVPLESDGHVIRIMNGATNSADNSIYYDALMLVEGDGTDTNGQVLAYFDGDTPDTPDYNFGWTGTAGLSSSTRTPLVQRSPDVLQWLPGTGGMSFLQPILQATGLRLFKDVDRGWLIVDNSYIVAGQTRIAHGMNLYGATDLVSRTAAQSDGLPLFADAVFLSYHWIESGTGTERTATDVAAPAGYTKPYTPDTIEGPFPGAGRAAYVLSRLQARARQLQVTAAVDYSVRPGQEAVITTVDGGVQTGYVDAVTWDFGNDEMTVVTKALIAAQANSVGRAPINQTIGSVTGTIAEYTN